MGYFCKIRCPVCGWQLSPATWLREHSLKDERSIGITFYSKGKSGIRVSSPVFNPADLKLREDEKGVLEKVRNKFLRAIEHWTDWKWLDRKAVLRIFGIVPLPGRGYIERFEKFGELPGERIICTYDGPSGLSIEKERQSVSPVREVKEYV